MIKKQSTRESSSEGDFETSVSMTYRVVFSFFLNVHHLKIDLLNCRYKKLYKYVFAFAEHIPDIYQTELQLNKANTSEKETSFLDLNIKVIIFTPAFTTNGKTLDSLL